MKSILAVTVNYRGPQDTLTCLHSLARERETVPGLTAIVIDNDSQDDSVSTIQRGIDENGWGDWAQIHGHNRNDGFGAGNNFALRTALTNFPVPDFFLLTNPDTEFQAGALQTMLQFQSEENGADIIGPSTENNDGVVGPTAFRFPGILNGFSAGINLGIVSKLFGRWELAPPPPAISAKTDWLSGGCMLIRRDVFQDIGVFDETFFLYFEETDLCKRAARNGWSSWYVPEARIIHRAGSSTGFASEGRATIPTPVCWFASREYYLLKHHGPIYKTLCDLAFLAGRTIWNLRSFLRLSRGHHGDPPHHMRDFFFWNVLHRRAAPHSGGEGSSSPTRGVRTQAD